jgi:pyridoxal phosphate enzyme (YggS family)
VSGIAENVSRIRDRIAAAARRVRRNPEEIWLVAVSKTVELDRIRQAIEAGVKILGENYVQEAQKKIELLGHGVEWHFIGHLQTNKAKSAVRLFDRIHSVDSLRIAQELSRAAQQQQKIVPVLLQVNIAEEETKFGAKAEEVFQLLEQISSLPGISIRGLMTMPPFFENPEGSRPYFRSLRKLAEIISRRNIPRIRMEELSMGMSNDFEVSIEEGATLIRVGTAIFGPRPV